MESRTVVELLVTALMVISTVTGDCVNDLMKSRRT